MSSDLAKKDKLARNLYILPQFGASAGMAYFSSYLGMLFTDIYMLPVILAGVLETTRSLISWLAGPFFGTLFDRLNIKGKFWKAVIIGTVIGTGANALTFILPSLTETPERLAFFAFILGILMSLFSAVSASALNTIYPKLSADPKTRSYLAIGQKIGRDGGKTLWGLIVPSLLVYLTAKGGSNAAGWASTAYIIGIFGIGVSIIYALVLRGSSFGGDADEKAANKPKVPLSLVFKTLLTNKSLLALFIGFTIHKIYYFFQILTASYYFKYIVGNFDRLGIFMTSFNLSAVVGAIFGGAVWIKIWKDSKRSFVAAGVVHLIFLAILTAFCRSMSVGVFITFVGCASFFAGTIEAYLMPMFAACSDWQAWKTGERADGLTMATFNLTVNCGITFSTILRTALLAWAGYNAAAYAEGAVPSAGVLNVFINFQTLYPLIMGIVAFGIIQLFYEITDKKLAIIQKEIKAGRVGKLRDESTVSAAV